LLQPVEKKNASSNGWEKKLEGMEHAMGKLEMKWGLSAKGMQTIHLYRFPCSRSCQPENAAFPAFYLSLGRVQCC
jgi:hypothetical protein